MLVDRSATTVKGSMMRADTFSVSIDWKEAKFSSNAVSVSGLILKMTFDRSGKTWAMTALEAAKAVVNNENVVNSNISVCHMKA